MGGQEETLPLVREEATLGRQTVETGRVRVAIETVERTQPIDVTLAETEVSVVRVQVGRFVDAVPAPRREGEVTVYPVVEEQAVVTVRLFLREELHVRTATVQHAERQSVVLRSQQATVVRLPPEQAGGSHVHPTFEGRKSDD